MSLNSREKFAFVVEKGAHPYGSRKLNFEKGAQTYCVHNRVRQTQNVYGNNSICISLCRFTVESVANDLPVDFSKAARNKQIMDEHFIMPLPRRLSAIEEGNTIRSINELLTPSATQVSLKDEMQDTIQESPQERQVHFLS